MAETTPTRFNPDRAYAIVVDDEGFIFDDEDLDAWADQYDEESEWADAERFDDDGEPLDDDDEEDESEPHRVLIVTGTAIPRSQSDDVDDFHRVPAGYAASDVLAEHEVGTLPAEDVITLYMAARAAADAHNAA